MIPGSASSLVCQEYIRLDKALRLRTASAYVTKFKLYLVFTSWHQLPLYEVDVILAFLEFLTQNGGRAQTLASYVSVLKLYFKLFDIDNHGLSHRKIQLFIRSVPVNSVYIPKFKANITISLLLNILEKCKELKYGQVYRAAFLLAYFAFLRLSNVVPISGKTVIAAINLLRSDIIFGPPGDPIMLKSTPGECHTSSQRSSSGTNTLPYPLPFVPGICHEILLAAVPASSSFPFFLSPPCWCFHSHCPYGFGHSFKNLYPMPSQSSPLWLPIL